MNPVKSRNSINSADSSQTNRTSNGMKTYSGKPSEVTRKWYLVAASQLPLGRLATQVATLLTGKGKPMFTNHIDCGDYVVVINSKALIVTGKKQEDKIFY